MAKQTISPADAYARDRALIQEAEALFAKARNEGRNLTPAEGKRTREIRAEVDALRGGEGMPPLEPPKS